jgi:hypothetical protein
MPKSDARRAEPQDGLGMAAGPQSSVDEMAPRPHIQELNSGLEENWRVGHCRLGAF